MESIIGLIPGIGKYINRRPNFKKVASNISWLFVDKFLRMGVGLFVGAWVARYLGPEQYGLWNYAISFASFFAIFATLGFDSIVVREIVRNPENVGELLGTIFTLKLTGAFFAFVLSACGAYFVIGADSLTILLVLLSSAGFVFQSLLTIDLHYQSQIKSKYTVWSQNIAFLLVTIIKVVLIFHKAPLLYFAAVGLLEIVIAGIFLIISYLCLEHSFRDWRYSFRTAKSITRDAWPILIGGLAFVIQFNFSQFVLGQILGNDAVGVYSVASRLSTFWHFIPGMFLTSIAPILFNHEGNLHLKIYKISCVLVWVSVVISLVFFLFSDNIVFALFGADYAGAAGLLRVMVLSNVLIFFNSVWNYWMYSLNDTVSTLKFHMTTAFLLIIFTIILSNMYGVIGAAYAQVFPVLITSLVFYLSVKPQAGRLFASIFFGKQIFIPNLRSQ